VREQSAKIGPSLSRGQTSIGDLLFSREANDGVPAGAMSVIGGAGRVTVTLTPPILPEGWTIDSAFAAALKQKEAEPMPTFHVGCQTSAPYIFDIAGLARGEAYVVSAWLQMTRPDGAMAYGQARTMIATTI
jgi:hypothetical protein